MRLVSEELQEIADRSIRKKWYDPCWLDATLYNRLTPLIARVKNGERKVIAAQIIIEGLEDIIEKLEAAGVADI